MSAPATHPPKYRHYKPKDLAVVRIDGRDHYLGKFGSPESREKYHRLIAEWIASDRVDRSQQLGGNSDASPIGPTINELILAFWRHSEIYYRRLDGTTTGELDNIRLALRPLKQLYGSTPASDFGPLALKAVRQNMIESGLCRRTVNQRIGRVVRVFRYGVENELVPPSVHHGLKAVPGLKAGRSGAKESRAVRPVPEAHVEAVRPHVGLQLWALIELQRLTGMRSGEVTTMRTCDLDTSGRVWVYTPQRHKAEHHDRERKVYLGPRAQAVLRPWLRPDLAAYLFSPREAMEEWRAERGRARKTPLTPSQRARTRKARPKKVPGDFYDSRAYAHAVEKACQKAGVPHWHPHQLRHNAATWLRKEFGLEVARVILGHASSAVTEVYAEIDREKAVEIMGQVG